MDDDFKPRRCCEFTAVAMREALTERFAGSDAEYETVARQARDLGDAEKVSKDRGAQLTVDVIIRNLQDAPDELSVAERWNWLLGALEVAYGGYERFQVRTVPQGDSHS